MNSSIGQTRFPRRLIELRYILPAAPPIVAWLDQRREVGLIELRYTLPAATPRA